MEPLSVTASVVGLLAAAGKVASILSKMKSSVSDAPSSIEQTLFHVKELQACFAAMHKFIIGASPIAPASQRRLSMIGVDQLVATLTESVLTFSELELLVTPFETCSQASMRNLIKWAWKEDVLSSIMLRLDRHKSTLSLMLNIVQWSSALMCLSESDREAEQSQQSLLLLVQQLVESNVDISRRLKTLETTFETESILTACFRNGNSVETGESEENTTGQALEISQRATSMILDDSSAGLPRIIFHSAFEDDLNDSRVYKRTQPYECDVSFTSSAVRSHSWSVFSGLSLSQISSISVIALPVYSHEIANKEWYGFVFFDRPDPQGASTLAAIDEVVQEEEGEEDEDDEIDYSDNIYDDDSDSEPEEASHSGRKNADFWIPQATPDGRLFYFNTMTGESSPALPLESSSSRMQNKTGDPSSVEISTQLRPSLEIIESNNTEGENREESDGSSSLEDEEGDEPILASVDPRPSNKGASTNPISQSVNTNMPTIRPSNKVASTNPASQSVNTNMSTIRPYVPSPSISTGARRIILYKLVVLGDGGVGKTDLVIQLQHFVESYNPTIDDSYRKQVVIDGQSCMLEILDTAGQEEYTSLRDQWIRDGEGFVLVYSISSRSSFTRISRYHNQIQRVKEAQPFQDSPFKMPPIMLVGNNCHRVTEREVSTMEGNALAREIGCKFCEASTENGINVEKAFYDVVRQLRRERIQATHRYAPRQYGQPQKKAGGVSQVLQRMRARAS